MGSTFSRSKSFQRLPLSNEISLHDLPENMALVSQASSQPVLLSKIPQMFFESTLKLKECDMLSSCYYFQKSGAKPMMSMPIHEVCFGISEISSFVEYFTANSSRMKYLKTLSMHWNILSYQDLENDYTKLKGRVHKLGNQLRKLKNLEHLVFKISRNQPKSLLSLFQTVVHNKQMKKLAFELQASKFQKEDILRITNLLKGAVNLRELSLSFKRCMLSEDAFNTLFDCIYRLSGLKSLKLNFAFVNNLHEESIQKIIKLPKKLPQLDSFYVNMSGTDIEDRHVHKMMEIFSKSQIMKQCYVKVGLCRKVSFLMASKASGLKGFIISK